MVAPLAAAASAAAPAAAAITINHTAANFSNAVGGTSNIFQDNDALPGNETFITGDSPFGVPNVLKFNSAASTPITLNTQFDLGTFSFENGLTQQFSHATAVSLSLTSSITTGSGTFSPSPFLFQLALDITDNILPCAHPSDTPCSDAVTFTILNGTGTFMDGGTAYTLFIDGFRDSAGNILPSFISQENTTTTATVIGRFAAANAVPEPATWAMMIAGFALVGGVMRRQVLAIGQVA